MARPTLMAGIVLALVAYGFDCHESATREEAMQCCENMDCSSHGHGHNEDCCKTMPSTHSPFVRPSSSQSVHGLLVLYAVEPPVSTPQSIDLPAQDFLVARSHAPPIPQSAALSPLRI